MAEKDQCACHLGSVCTDGCKKGKCHNGCPRENEPNGHWESVRGENHGLNSKPGDVWVPKGCESDRQKLGNVLLTFLVKTEMVKEGEEPDVDRMVALMCTVLHDWDKAKMELVQEVAQSTKDNESWDKEKYEKLWKLLKIDGIGLTWGQETFIRMRRK